MMRRFFFFFLKHFLLTRWISGERPLYRVKVLTELLLKTYHLSCKVSISPWRVWRFFVVFSRSERLSAVLS
jgi:hypothetical protein